MTIIDAHCHLANLAVEHDVPQLIASCNKHDRYKFFSIALMHSEVHWHLSNPIPDVEWCTGIHPNFDECDLDLETLEDLLLKRRMSAIGEIGLDRNGGDLSSQRKIFSDQLILAEKYRVPVVLHIVGHQDAAFELMTPHPLKYLVHGYAGSLEGFELLNRLDCTWTISSRLLKEDKHDLLKAMVASGKYVFESDMTRYYVTDPVANPLLKTRFVMEETSRLLHRNIIDLAVVALSTYAAFWGRG